MVARFLTELQPSISSARLQRYQSLTGDPFETAVNYLWNMALAEALYCSLNAVEIALRNGLHNALTRHFGVPNWYERRGLLEPNQANDIAKARTRIANRGDSVIPDRVVSEVTFGFWVTILSRPYDARLWRGGYTVPLKYAFMRIPKRQRQRQTIHQQYNAIRELRNRVFHHEPLFDDRLLLRRHEEVKRGLSWLNPKMVDCIEWYDRFPDVYHFGRSQIEATLRTELGIPQT